MGILAEIATKINVVSTQGDISELGLLTVNLRTPYDAVSDYVEATAEKLRDAGVRVSITSGERLAKLVRNAEKAKIPVMAVVGAEEAENGTLALRSYADGDIGGAARAAQTRPWVESTQFQNFDREEG